MNKATSKSDLSRAAVTHVMLWVCLLLVYVTLTAATSLAEVKVSEAVEAASCSMPLENIKGHDGKVKFRFKLDGIPDTSAAGKSYIAVVFYSPNEREAFVVLSEKDAHGKLRALKDNYTLRRTKRGWAVDPEISGNGSVGMYERVERFVEELSKQHCYEITLNAPNSSRCADAE